MTDLNGNEIFDGWKEGAPVQFILKGTQAFFKAGGGLNGDLPPINPNMSGSLEDGVFTVMADKLPVSQANELAGAEWYYGDHVPARPGDGTKIELSKSQLVDMAGMKTAADYTPGDIVKITEDGVAVEFYIAAQDYESGLNGAGRVLVVRKDCFDNRAWNSSNTNPYADSDLDNFYNITYKAKLSPAVQAMIGTTKFYYTIGGTNNTVTTLERSVFGLSLTELGQTHANANAEGTALPIASVLAVAMLNEAANTQWTRSPYTGDGYRVWRLDTSGLLGFFAANQNGGSRPAFTIPSTALFDPDTNELIEDATAGVQTLADTTNLGDETEGSIVTLQEDGAAVEFYVAKQNYESALNGEGRVLLVRKDCYDNRVWDADGLNHYAESDIDAWCNGDYKLKLSPAVQAMMGTTKFYYTIGTDNKTVDVLSRSVFLLSFTEVGFEKLSYTNVEGSPIPYFNTDSSRIALLNGEASTYWLRSININSGSAMSVYKTGVYSSSVSELPNGDTRPCFTLPANTQVRPDGSIVEIDTSSPTITLSIPWTSSSYIYVRQFPFNAKHQYQTQLVGAVATNDPDYGGGPPDVDPVLANNTWEQIAAASEYGIAADTWQVGDTIDILAGAETLTMEIVGFDHDDLADGSGKAGITFGMKNLMANTHQMNTTQTNAGGYTASGMYDYLTTDVFPNLQEDLKAVIKTVNKKTSAGGGSSEIVTTAMQLFNFAEVEIYGTLTWSAPGEGTIYERFVTAESRLKNLANGTGANQLWWERSPRANATDSFCIVHSGDAHANSATATWSAGVCFGFCV